MAKRDARRQAQLLVRWHHEWWNGSGYPDMLAFEDIPVGARILRAVELCAALLGDRPYRAAQDEQQAIEALTSSAGIECDPYVVKALLALLEELFAGIQRSEAAAIVDTPAAEAAMEREPLPEHPIAVDLVPEPSPISGHTLADEASQEQMSLLEHTVNIEPASNPAAPASLIDPLSCCPELPNREDRHDAFVTAPTMGRGAARVCPDDS